ncbi:hypothetical protein HMPREF1978_01647 [Actinomyces graevenitzii F0530]|uniref:Uncharacterized protein n=1 Tax=Actinomyces graevenitzii F0530 TaxID=1321817 RepID=U1R7W7_9ACTO|nr:hypothetical protein HMPREF1978_01647 [Actinomyces graevenitzii F0530]
MCTIARDFFQSQVFTKPAGESTFEEDLQKINNYFLWKIVN